MPHPIHASVPSVDLDVYLDPEPEEQRTNRLRFVPHQTIGLYAEQTPAEIWFGAFLGWHPNFTDFDRLMEIDAGSGALAASGLVFAELQTGGHSCAVRSLLARPVAIATDKMAWCAALCADYFHYWGGHFHPHQPQFNPEAAAAFVSEVSLYRERLAAIGLTADYVLGNAGERLCEAVYSIDAIDGNLATLLADAPAEVRALSRFAEDPGLRSCMVLVLLAENSD